MTDEFYMQLALNKAWEYQGLTYPNPAVGAVPQRGVFTFFKAFMQSSLSDFDLKSLRKAKDYKSIQKLDFCSTLCYTTSNILHPPLYNVPTKECF